MPTKALFLSLTLKSIKPAIFKFLNSYKMTVILKPTFPIWRNPEILIFLKF